MADFSNFDFLKSHHDWLFKLAESAERNFVPFPNTALVNVRQLGEAIAQTIASRVGVEYGANVKQIDLLKELDCVLRLDDNVRDAFHTIRKLGNSATHAFDSSTHRDALKALMVGHALSMWFHITFGGDAAKGFKIQKFVKPEDPSDYVRQLEEQVERLKVESQRTEDRIRVAEELSKVEADKAQAEKLRAEKMAEEKAIWEELAEEQEKTLSSYRLKMDEANILYRQMFHSKSKADQASEIQRIEKSLFEMDEAETRVIIDQQLVDAGWEADTENLRYSKGVRPEPNKNRAIAEWPTKSGPADYALFMGMTLVATIEAKKSAKNVYGAVDQAKRYAKGIQHLPSNVEVTQHNEFLVPVVFATNGRAYLKQLKQESGIWFLDVRDSTNRRKALKGWYTPAELKEYLRQTPQKANAELDEMGFEYELKLRDYQKAAILSVEKAIKDGEEKALVAMATGTGKTKTCIALVYRLLKAQRFRRILFLVDRSALGVQASVDFGEVRMENLNTFADTFEVMGMEPDKAPKAVPDDDTKVHVATVQGLVKRIMYPSENGSKPGVGQYDCIVVDECHRGYLLDRELSDTEIKFRDQKDYMSKYRAVIEYFDAFKVGLTATPAIHTVDIFGEPVFSYSYTEAVIDGHLVDHLPPVRIHTKLNTEGINYQVNEEVQVYDPQTQQLDLIHTPDELDFDVSDFNRKVIAPEFTKVISKWLIESDSLNPYSQEKSLIFCVTDRHADEVVEALKQACEDYHGEVEDDAIQKITGASDKPLEKIRLFKNDRLPNIAVTVDLLTTGVDVPSICNLVFLRRVNSRILFEQMLGRATRRCDDIGKERFRIYDAVDIYKQLEKVNTMKPVVTKVDITFSELEQEITKGADIKLQELAKDQFLAKLQSKKNYLTPLQQDEFERIVGKPPKEFAKELKAMNTEDVASWFVSHPGLGELLDMKVLGGSGRNKIVISDKPDDVTGTSTGYGSGQKPEDYLSSFAAFVNANSNRMVALQTVIQRPWELTRTDLKQLVVELEKNEFREEELKVAWKEVKNEDIAARIIGFIRQAAIGEALIPYEQRVDKALEKILASRAWKTPQREWLETIAAQMKANIVVDESNLNEGIFKQRLGGLQRANKLFEQPVVDVLAQFNRAMWSDDDRKETA
ncbi:type I restriction-modification system endonuclease [Vibrio cholerae]|uniref:type I restriction-modification system endonuclease n=1 Tax=Vibrio TaxID=662 RepID=UPI000DE20450|nr:MULTISPECIES: type I restriction-modification system endonuclease [Vibrio]EKF9261417.1 type I restriction-modification system endonuclease [Vibrio cholerae]EKF9917167.1 type I restriction-modification system endonuclease [Vibrio cholerae]EKF9924634.1 type I restriction-modification system endonuclease [Vibrio cholerae]EKG0030278.1 type I restriction-modification system endonuclease [Vibrio cholerae]RBM88599.1 type I restriction-modification system endonuclease [Vibrio paracholerae]